MDQVICVRACLWSVIKNWIISAMLNYGKFNFAKSV